MRSVVNKLLLSAAIIIAAIFIYTDGHKLENFHGDAFGYYLYLPGTFIYHNITSDNVSDIPVSRVSKEDPIRWALNQFTENGRKTEKGKIVDQYTYGIAFLESPFFFAAHIYEKARGLPANGFSDNYQIAIKIASLFYALLGLIVIYFILKRYFNSNVATLAAVSLFLGSNLFWFATYHSGMSHVPLFFLYALLIYFTIRLYEQPHIKWFLAIGFLAGLITIIRPTDVICLLIPLLYKVYDKQTLLDKIAFLKQHYQKILLMAIVFVIPIIPQLLYWKAISGHYLFYSYGDQEFYWKHPRLIDGLLGANNGWLAYSPLMVFCLFGFLLKKRVLHWYWCLWVLFPLYCYIIYSWYCYNYINGLGSRPMLHMYPLLSIPLAAFYDYMGSRKLWMRSAVGALAVFLVAVNISFAYEQRRGVLVSEESNYAFNIGMMFRTKLRYNDLVVNDIAEFQPGSAKLQKVAILGFEGFEDTVSGHYYKDESGHSQYVYRFSDEEYGKKEINLVYHKNDFKDARWFRCSARFMYPDYAGYFKHMLVLDIKTPGAEKSKLWKGCKVENKIGISDSAFKHQQIRLDHQEPNKWGPVYFYAKIPGNIKEGDVIKLYLWNSGKMPLYMDDLALELYK